MRSALSAAAIIFAAGIPPAAQAADLKVLSGNGARAAVVELAALSAAGVEPFVE
jgi:hypothetical protein